MPTIQHLTFDSTLVMCAINLHSRDKPMTYKVITPKSETLTVWELACIEEAMRSYEMPGLTDLAKVQYKTLIAKVSHARAARLIYKG